MSVSREWLYEEVWAEPKRKVEAHYCVSSSFLARVCQRMNVPCPPRGSWARKTAGMTSKAPPLPASEPGDELAWVNGRGGTFLVSPTLHLRHGSHGEPRAIAFTLGTENVLASAREERGVQMPLAEQI